MTPGSCVRQGLEGLKCLDFDILMHMYNRLMLTPAAFSFDLIVSYSSVENLPECLVTENHPEHAV